MGFTFYPYQIWTPFKKKKKKKKKKKTIESIKRVHDLDS